MLQYSCKDIAEQIKQYIKTNFINDGLSIAIISNGSPEGERYIRNKVKVAQECGIKANVYTCEDKTPSKVIADLKKLNEIGIIVQMPFTQDKKIDEDIISFIPRHKDADGLGINPIVTPATAQGIAMFLQANNLIDNKNIVIIGRSKLVGKPLAKLLTDTDATVTMCHSKTKDIKQYTLNADVVVVAVGQRKFLTKDMVKENTIIVDVGINFDENGKMCGDVDPEVKEHCEVTPVPGGVGLLTTAALMLNIKNLSYHNA